MTKATFYGSYGVLLDASSIVSLDQRKKASIYLKLTSIFLQGTKYNGAVSTMLLKIINLSKNLVMDQLYY